MSLAATRAIEVSHRAAPCTGCRRHGDVIATRCGCMHRAGRDGAGRGQSMLALQVESRPTPVYRVFRPATGRTPKQLTLQELRARCAFFGMLL